MEAGSGAVSEIVNVAVVVLGWNAEEETLECLESVVASDWPRITVVVVDNGSDPPLAPSVTARFPDAVAVRNERNLGFAGGMNVGLRQALALGADYVLLLNNDTLVDRPMVRRLLEAARTHPDAGILSPLVLYQDAPEVIASAGSGFDPRRGHPGRSLLAGVRNGSHLHGVREVEASSGEAMFVSAAAARRVGPLDEGLYVRLEDIDWSLRMRRAGLRNYVVLDARLWHGVSRSSGGDHSAFTAYYHTRNILFVCTRHAPLGGVRSALREAEVVLANLAHARHGARPLENARAAIAGWRDFRRGRMGPR
jgi:GT2 family glycosyltransferase